MCPKSLLARVDADHLRIVVEQPRHSFDQAIGRAFEVVLAQVHVDVGARQLRVPE